MQDIEEDLIEECVLAPQKIKKTIYVPPIKPKYKSNSIRTKKGRCYDMNEKFLYVIERIDPERASEFHHLKNAQQQRIFKLFNDYHTLNFPITSIEAGRIGKENGRDMHRVLQLLKISSLIVEITEDGDKIRKYDKISTSSEEALEILIDSREAMTRWENDYYGASRRRKREEKRKEKEGVAFSQTLKNFKEVDPALVFEEQRQEKYAKLSKDSKDAANVILEKYYTDEEKDKELSDFVEETAQMYHDQQKMNEEVEMVLERLRNKIEEMFPDLREKFIAMRAVFPKMEFDSFYEFFLRCYSEESGYGA